MEGMKKGLAIISSLIIMLAIGGALYAAAQDDYEGPMSNLSFLVVRDYNGKPVKNAAVVLHPVSRKGKQDKGGLELKTDNDGRTNIDGIPYGPLRVQVVAQGFQTFGEDYEIGKPETAITVKLKRPAELYSSFGTSGQPSKTDDKKPPEQKPQ